MPCHEKMNSINYFICGSYSPTVYAIMLICRLGDFSYLEGYGLFEVMRCFLRALAEKVKKKICTSMDNFKGHGSQENQ